VSGRGNLAQHRERGAQQTPQRVDGGVLVSGVEEKAGVAVRQQIGDAEDLGRRHRKAEGQRLEDGSRH